MNLKRILTIGITFLLTSCGPPQPQYQTTYQLVQPPTESGRYCANNCLSTKQMCNQNCTTQQINCENMNQLQEQNNRLQAKIEYDDYVRSRKAQGKEIKRSPSYFRNYSSNICYTNDCNAQCDLSFNMCYENCGGKVIAHTSCVANCNMPPQQ